MTKYVIELKFNVSENENIETSIYKIDEDGDRNHIEELTFSNISDCLHFWEGYCYCLIEKGEDE